MLSCSPRMLLGQACCTNLTKSETATRSQAFRRIYPVASLSPSAGAGGAAVRDAAEQLLRQPRVRQPRVRKWMPARSFLNVADTTVLYSTIVSTAARERWHERDHVEHNYRPLSGHGVHDSHASFPVPVGIVLEARIFEGVVRAGVLRRSRQAACILTWAEALLRKGGFHHMFPVFQHDYMDTDEVRQKTSRT